MEFPFHSVRDVDSAGNAHDLNILCLQASLEDYRRCKELSEQLQAATKHRQKLTEDIEELNMEVERAYILEQEKNARICALEELMEKDGLASIERVRQRDISIRDLQAKAEDAKKVFEDRLFELESSLTLHRMNTASVQRKLAQHQDELAMACLIQEQQTEKIAEFEASIADNKDELQRAAEHISALETARACELEKGRAADAQLAALEQQRAHDEASLKERLAESETFARALQQARISEHQRNYQKDLEMQSLSNHTAEQARQMSEQAASAHQLISSLNELLSQQEQATRAAAMERTMHRAEADRDAWRTTQRLRSTEQRLEMLQQQTHLLDSHLHTQVHSSGMVSSHLGQAHTTRCRGVSCCCHIKPHPLCPSSLGVRAFYQVSPQTHELEAFRGSPSRTHDINRAPPGVLVARSLALRGADAEQSQFHSTTTHTLSQSARMQSSGLARR